ncbi:MAG TPA: hypothetical protein VJ932_01685 [Alkalispirochaeta sp.]|nr:hypothetical protein [Alkalispirochaeta sp.]
MRGVPVAVLGILSVSGLIMFFASDAAGLTADAVSGAIARGEALQGGATARFDAEVEQAHPYRDAAVPVIAALRYGILRHGSPGVIVGREGWLFTDEELQHHPGDETRLRERLQYVKDVAAHLDHEFETPLVVVVVPSKARVAADFVPPYLEPAVAHDRTRWAVEALAEVDITVVDAAAALTPQDFFLRDTHWRPRGARRVARAVDQAMPGFHGFNERYELRRLAEQELEGDLLSFVPVGRWRGLLGLTKERFRPVEAVRVGTASAGGGLFDTPTIPITLVGTSYSADPRFGFEDALRATLQGDVLNVAEPAGGPFQPMETYLRGETITDVPPELVIWEIPERYLTLPSVDTPETPRSRTLDGRRR